MAPTIALAEVDVEDTLIGSIITFPDVLGAIAGDVDPDWFTTRTGAPWSKRRSSCTAMATRSPPRHWRPRCRPWWNHAGSPEVPLLPG
jgi:hypothetical protein